jgi:hypothetical protein
MNLILIEAPLNQTSASGCGYGTRLREVFIQEEGYVPGPPGTKSLDVASVLCIKGIAELREMGWTVDIGAFKFILSVL